MKLKVGNPIYFHRRTDGKKLKGIIIDETADYWLVKTKDGKEHHITDSDLASDSGRIR